MGGSAGMSPPLLALILAPLLLSFAVGLAATIAGERLARRVGLVVAPREDRWHRRPVPLLGGVAIMVGTLPGLSWTGFSGSRTGVAFLAALGMGVVGLVDDIRPLRPPVKLISQVVVAALLVQLGFAFRLNAHPLVNVLLTVGWIVGITNAVNLLDNMDGLAAGLAAIAAAFRLVFFVMDGQSTEVRVTAAFIGALAGFLVRNFPPARIFMGDAGSLFVGCLLGALSLAPTGAYSRGILGVLALPILVLAIPIFDTTFVTLTRLLTGRPVSQGGRDHTSHRLVALGLGEWGALTCLYGIAVGSGFLAVLSYRFGFTYTIVLLTLLLVGLALLGVHLSRVPVIRPHGPALETPGADTRLVRLAADFPYRRHAAIVALDLVLIVLAYYSAYLLRFEDTFDVELIQFARTVAPLLASQILALGLSGAYRGLWRYTSLAHLGRLVGAITLGSLAAVVYFVFTTRFAGLSRAVFVLDWILLSVLVSASRVSFRVLGALLRPPRAGARRVLIYGAGDGGELVVRELRNNLDLGREPVGFVDDDRHKVGARIHEVAVLGSLEALPDLLARHQVHEVVVSSRKIPAERLRRLQALCAAREVAVVRVSVRVDWDGLEGSS